ncbi:MAG: LytR C-terminal domain-containing protein [candidate division KSB1 bacterium]|nr:LytR C-terminal domain-containing protein [candidate division KSB1 bacterium]
MNVRNRRKSHKAKLQRSTSTKYSSRKQDKWGILKSGLTTVAIWGLVIANLFLIASLVSRFWESPKQESAMIIQQEPQINIDVEVLNGCGVDGVASKITEYLRAKGFDVVYFGNYTRFDIEETIVIDRRSLDKENAKKVAEALGITNEKNIIQIKNDQKQLDVSVIIGKDYPRLKAYRKKE